MDPVAAELARLERTFSGLLEQALAALHPPQAPPVLPPQQGRRKQQRQPSSALLSLQGQLESAQAEQAAWAALTAARQALGRAYTERLAGCVGEEQQAVAVAQRLWLLYYKEVEALQVRFGCGMSETVM